MKRVLLRAPLLTQSGYGVHSRQLARWLFSKPNLDVYCQVLPWGDTPWYLDKNALDGLVGKIMERTKPIEGADVSFQLQLPNEWDASLGKTNIGITASVETDKCNPEWVTAANKMSAIVFPSQHAKASLVNSGPVSVPTYIVPEAFSSSCVLPDSELPTIPEFSTKFNFLVFGQLTGNNPHSDRKNTFFTLKWLFETFHDDPDVGIVLKTNTGRNSLIDRKNVTNIITQVVNESRNGAYPRVHLLHGDMSDAEVASLYRHDQIKALVALTRGEGFGLPILEAAASGLPIIATNWSGHLDFLKLGKFISVFYQLQNVHPSRIDKQIFVEGARWAEPSEVDFKKRVKKFRSSSSIPKQWATDLQQKIVEQYAEKAIHAAYDEALKGVIE